MSNLLMKCGACGNEVSVKAPACPKCGHPNHQPAASAAVSLDPQNLFDKFQIGRPWIIVGAIVGIFLIAKVVSKNPANGGSREQSSYGDSLFQDDPVSEPARASETNRRPVRRPNSKPDSAQGLVSKFGPKPIQSHENGPYREVSDYLRQASKDPVRITSCLKVQSDEKVGWLVGCSFQTSSRSGEPVKYANWFVIRDQKVVKLLGRDAYQINDSLY